jgi:hypothetical protein
MKAVGIMKPRIVSDMPSQAKRGLVSMATRPVMSCRPKAIIAPHAAYLCSARWRASPYGRVDKRPLGASATASTTAGPVQLRSLRNASHFSAVERQI